MAPLSDPAVNAVTLEVFGNLFASVAEEMGTALCRSALSPNIKERRDFSCIVCDRRGNLIAQAAHIPVHLGSAPLSVQAVLDTMELREGDIAILNDPFCGGTHLPDLTMVQPVMLDDVPDGPAFYTANRAHHADVGGMSAGSMPVSEELFQEGIVIPPMKIVKAGKRDEDILKLFLANVRTPTEREGDVDAQIASLRTGVRRLREIAQRRGSAETLRYADALMDYSENIMRSVLSSLPDGDYRAEDELENDGFSNGSIPVRVCVRILGDRAEIDFTGSSPQIRGNLNAVEAITVSAVLYVFRLLCPVEIPSNSGTLRPLTIIMPFGSVVNARRPAAVAGGNVETSQRLVDVLLRALAHAAPDRIPAASQGTMNNVTVGAADPDPLRSFAYYETTGGGAGAGPEGDGVSALHSHMTNTLNTPIEALESSYPLRVERFEIRRNSGGGGLHRGGDGIRRDIRLLTPARVTIISERREHGPYGLAGAEPGKPGRNVLIHSDGSERELPSKITLRADEGDVVSIRTPGGGGWGSKK